MSLGLRNNRGTQTEQLFDEAIRRDGSWFLYRRYDLDAPAPREKLTGEGQGTADRWEFHDEPILARQESTGITGTRGIITDKSIFLIEPDDRPKRGDVVIRVDIPNAPSYTITPDEVLLADHIEAYRIVEIDPKRTAFGVVNHYACVVEPELGNY